MSDEDSSQLAQLANPGPKDFRSVTSSSTDWRYTRCSSIGAAKFSLSNIFELPIIAPLTAESLMMSYC